MHPGSSTPYASFNPYHVQTSGRRASKPRSPSLDVLTKPANTLAVTLSHDDTAHEDFDRPDALEWHLALASCLVQTKGCPQLVLGDCVRVIDLVSENDEGGVGELFHGQQSVELGF